MERLQCKFLTTKMLCNSFVLVFFGASVVPLTPRALAIDERSYGLDHPSVARDFNNLAQLRQATNRLAEAELLSWRMVSIFLGFGKASGHEPP